MKNSYSVAVIGSGLGGLTAAVILARAGAKVILFERHHTTGGYATQFKRKGFTFDLALHSVPAGGKGEPFYKLIKEIGLEEKIRFIKLSQGPAVRIGAKVYTLPNEPDTLFEYLNEQFPKEKKHLKRFRAYLEKYSRIYSNILIEQAPLYKSLPSFLPRIPAFLYQSFESTDKFLKSFFNDPVLIELLYQYAIFMGIPMKQFPAVNFIIMVSLLLTKGMYSIAGGGGGLSNALTSYLQNMGGMIKTGTEISSLIVNKNEVMQVCDSSGMEYPVDAVVANTNLPELLKMLPAGCLSKSYHKTISQLKPSIAVVQLHIGLDCSVEEIGIDRHLYFCFPETDIDKCIELQSNSLYPEGFSITAPGITDPEKTANNEKILSIVGGVNADKWFALSSQEYHKEKDNCSRLLLEKVYVLFPLLKEHVVVTDLATPCTFHRYTGNPGGALMGFNCTCGTHRGLLKISKLPIKNLFLANAWTDKLGGFMQCMRAGQCAANKIVKLMKHYKTKR